VSYYYNSRKIPLPVLIQINLRLFYSSFGDKMVIL